MKKFLAIILTLAMMLTLCAAVMAEDPATDTTPTMGSITITNPVVNVTYKAYRMLDLVGGNPDANGNFTAYSYTVNEEWKDFFYSKDASGKLTNTLSDEVNGYFVLEDGGFIKAKDTFTSDSDDIKTFAGKALAYAKSKDLTPLANQTPDKEYIVYNGKEYEISTTTNTDGIVSKQISIDGTSYDVNIRTENNVVKYSININGTATDVTYKVPPIEFENLPLGYYLIDSNLGALCSINTTKPDVEIREKNTPPTHEKTVQEGMHWGTENDADVGDIVRYRVVINIGNGATNYVFHDKMSEGLTFVPYKDGEKIGTAVSITELYTVPANAQGILVIYSKSGGYAVAESDNYTVTISPEYIVYEGTKYEITSSENSDKTVLKKVTINGTPYTINSRQENNTTKYYITINDENRDVTIENDGCTFEVKFKDSFINTLTSSDSIGIYYQARLNEKAVVGSTGNINDSKLTYGDNGEFSTEPKKTTTRTWEFSVEKVDGQKVEGQNPKKLSGAEFILATKNGSESDLEDKDKIKFVETQIEYVTYKDKSYDVETVKNGDTTSKQITINDVKYTIESNTVDDVVKYFIQIKYENDKLVDVPVEIKIRNEYKVCTHTGCEIDCGHTDADHTYTMISDSDGNIKIEGLDAGTYYLYETKAPVGYNKLTSSIKVIIDNEGNVKKDTSGSIENKTIIVENNTGSIMPSTGGAGTTAFCVIGGLIMLVSGVILVNKKKMSVYED